MVLIIKNENITTIWTHHLKVEKKTETLNF